MSGDVALTGPVVRIVGSRFAVQVPTEPNKTAQCWYDSNDEHVRVFVLRQERHSLVWQGAEGLWVRVAAELRTAGLLGPPLDLTKYVDELRRLSDELGGEYLPDATRRIMAELAKLEKSRST